MTRPGIATDLGENRHNVALELNLASGLTLRDLQGRSCLHAIPGPDQLRGSIGQRIKHQILQFGNRRILKLPLDLIRHIDRDPIGSGRDCNDMLQVVLRTDLDQWRIDGQRLIDHRCGDCRRWCWCWCRLGCCRCWCWCWLGCCRCWRRCRRRCRLCWRRCRCCRLLAQTHPWAGAQSPQGQTASQKH